MATGFQMRRLSATVFLAAALATTLAGQEEAPARRIGVIFEGSFEKVDVTLPIEGARKTQLVAFYEWDFGVRPFTEKVWNERGLTREKLIPVAKTLADELLRTLEPQMVRDSRGVILYSILADKNPFLTSVLISPDLIERFRNTLGDRILAVLVDRHRIYLFPATGGTLQTYGPALVEEFRRASLPVSLEVFLIDDDGYRVIGELERPDATDEGTVPLPTDSQARP